MGLTIHFWGRLKTQEDLDGVFSIGKAFAEKKKVRVAQFDIPETELFRIHNGMITTYHGRVKGMVFSLHDLADPVILEFDEDLYIQQFCKTSFAGLATHLQVIYLLKEIEPHFEKLIVYDEGGFWQTGDVERLAKNFS
jgi:hypothetical protein